ncbi:DUF1492 domain-containing protein [Acetobacterium sp.]|uniref:DUF1492 domain-containing protein n=1 Tax=Acetobacterium sp. TaxID=1872094 RepID=UPI00272069E2|nr:DUF1492 domain-containing protein [Acetobacterium sp.]MDO9492816.1 DUF1492 domain-containing protein [Acetobacterium sp.]
MSNKAVCRPKDKRKDEILRGYEYQMELAHSLENELEELIARATKTTSVITDMPRGGDGLDVGDWVAKWAPLQEQIEAEVVESVKVRAEITSYLNQVTMPKLRTVLQLTYIERITQEEIMDRMHYNSTQWVRELLNRALEQINI